MSSSPASALDDLLQVARDADGETQISYRDAIAANGEAAIEAMTEWLDDPDLAAFAIRVLVVIGQAPEFQPAVLDALWAVDREELPRHLDGDVDWAIRRLGRDPGRRRPDKRGVHRLGQGLPGIDGRGYWCMRTSPWERAFVWSEARAGRLRQGWGWTPEMDLDVIADLRARGAELDEGQQTSWRSRRMRTSEPDGMRLGDLVVAPNLPEWGRLSVFRVSGSYRYELAQPHGVERFGHILPVELLMGDVDRRSSAVTDGLRAALRPQSRLFSIVDYGGDVERLLGNKVPETSPATARDREPWTEQRVRDLVWPVSDRR